MEKPRLSAITVGVMYDTVADALPLEGRDFSLGVSNSQSGRPVVKVTPKTELGEAFVPFLVDKLRKNVTSHGVTVSVNNDVLGRVEQSLRDLNKDHAQEQLETRVVKERNKC